MKKTKIIFLVMVVAMVVGFGSGARAQNKIGIISFSELLTAMPEYKKADTTLAEYRSALEQKYQEFQAEFAQKQKELAGPDSLKFTAPQRDLKRKSLGELLAKLQGYDQEAGMMLNQKRNELLAPIQKKAEDAIQQVSKDNGYAYVLEKEGMHVYPPSDDILPLVKKKLGLR
jgi:outer membrane protein